MSNMVLYDLEYADGRVHRAISGQVNAGNPDDALVELRKRFSSKEIARVKLRSFNGVRVYTGW